MVYTVELVALVSRGPVLMLDCWTRRRRCSSAENRENGWCSDFAMLMSSLGGEARRIDVTSECR